MPFAQRRDRDNSVQFLSQHPVESSDRSVAHADSQESALQREEARHIFLSAAVEAKRLMCRTHTVRSAPTSGKSENYAERNDIDIVPASRFYHEYLWK